MATSPFKNFEQHPGAILSGNFLVKPPYLSMVSGADAKVKKRHWAIPDYLPLGELTVLAGPKAAGKSTLYATMAAAVSRGTSHPSWPYPLNQAPGGVMIISTEDDWYKDIVPRLIAAGADMSRIQNIVGIDENANTEETFRFQKKYDEHIYSSARAMGGVNLIIVDPWTHLIEGSADNAIMVQRKLERLKAFASHFNATILLIAHVIKAPKGRDPVARVSGNAAVVRVCRNLLLVAKIENSLEEDNATHVLVRAVTNIAASGNGWSYHIEGVDVPSDEGMVSVSKIIWDSELTGSPVAILEKAENTGTGKKASAVDIAGEFLITALAHGPRLISELISEAKVVGISEASLMRAKKAKGISHKKQGGSGQASAFHWYFEPNETV